MKLRPPINMRKNTVCPLCSLDLFVVCWVFVRTSFLQNPKKNVHLSLTEGCMFGTVLQGIFEISAELIFYSCTLQN